MEKNKYYTPEIEEFHVGFEYELSERVSIKNLKRSWNKHILTKEQFLQPINWSYLAKCIDKEHVRVKYLNKNDVKECGWEWSSRSREFSFGNYELQFRGDNFVMPNVKILSDQREMIFIGIIKNKSELKKLMKQLKIQ